MSRLGFDESAVTVKSVLGSGIIYSLFTHHPVNKLATLPELIQSGAVIVNDNGESGDSMEKGILPGPEISPV